MCDYCDGDGWVDKNGNPPSSGTAYGKLIPCPMCRKKKSKKPKKIVLE